MKTLLTFILFFALNLTAQTNIIALKSHSGSMNLINQETDNFGEPGPTLVKIEYLYDSCAAFTYREWSSNEEYIQTDCNGYIFKHVGFDEEDIKSYMGDHIELVNFDKYPLSKKNYDKKVNRKEDKKKDRRSRVRWLFLLLIPVGIYSLTKKGER